VYTRVGDAGTIWTTYEEPECDFGDMTPHTLVGGAQATLSSRASVRADRRDDPREALGPRGDTQSRPPGALDRCAGVTGAVGTARNTRHPPYLSILEYDHEGVKRLAGLHALCTN
jgi:hypothetical protein